jgi:hypothetical protein
LSSRTSVLLTAQYREHIFLSSRTSVLLTAQYREHVFFSSRTSVLLTAQYREHVFLLSRTSVLLTAHQAYRHTERHRYRSVYRNSRYPVGTIPRDIGEPIDREYRSRPRVPSRPGHVTYHAPLIATMSPQFSSCPLVSHRVPLNRRALIMITSAPLFLIMSPCF